MENKITNNIARPQETKKPIFWILFLASLGLWIGLISEYIIIIIVENFIDDYVDIWLVTIITTSVGFLSGNLSLGIIVGLVFSKLLIG